jgi:transglutaminase-like putative cysteine protease
MSERWAVESGMFGAAMVGALAVTRLVPGAGTAAFASAALGVVAVAVLRRRAGWAVVVGVVAVAVCSLGWGVHDVGGRLSFRSLSEVRRSLQAARAPLIAFHVPLVHTPGLVVLCSLVAGLSAVAGRALGIRFPALSLVPAGGLLVCSAILLPATGAALGGLVLGGCGFLVIGGQPGVVRRTVTLVAAVSLGAAALAVLWTVAGPGSGAVTPGGRTVPAVSPSALSLATDLTGVETKDADVVLFEARSPVTTYWQVASLTTFTGDTWVPSPATEAVLAGAAPPAPITAQTAGRHLFGARITVSGYVGRLLPAPPASVGVTGAPAPVLTSSGLVATSAVRPGNSYVVTAIVPAAVVDSPAGSPPPAADTALGPIPASVRSLALSITGGQPTPLEKAEALTDFFRSGRFHYSITAPVPAGGNPLVAFLTVTRTGSCEQFAGAFAVLARASGLAARVAIGFTPGRPNDGTSVVRGRDAHAWPQVVVDGNWVSFEPTPQLPSGELSPPGVLGPTGLGRPNPTGPGTFPKVSVPKPAVVNPTAPAATVPVPAVTGRHRAGSGGWIAAAVAVVAIGLAAVGLWLFRRRTGLDRVVGSWGAIDRALARRGLARPASSTPVGHVRALAAHRVSREAVATLGDMTLVATVLQDVTYGFAELTPDDVSRVARASRRARRAILSGALSGGVRPEPVVQAARAGASP